MSKQKESISRREFISGGIRDVGLAGLGGAIGLVAGRSLTNTPDKRASSSVESVFPYDLTYDLSDFS